MDYRISGERLTGIADQVRRISGVEGELTPEQMETNLLNVVPGSDLPNAEDGAFGVVKAENEYGINSAIDPFAITGRYTYGWAFTAAEAFSIIGFRNKNNYPVKLWDTNGNLIASASMSGVDADGWNFSYIDTPVTVAIGESYVVSTYTGSTNPIVTQSMEFNAKLTNTGKRHSSIKTDMFPALTNGSYYGTGDIIIAPVQSVLPDEYKVQRTTMDGIAEEVQRLTGATEKLTTAQMVEGLSEVEVLEDYEEVAF